MYAANFDYHRPKTLAEAMSLLARDPEAKVLAGGHSLIPAMKLRLSGPSAVVDISGLRDLSGIVSDGVTLTIGAVTTHAEVIASDAVKAHCPLLAETATQIGDIQVRNRGTLGGSLAHADPAADYPTAVTALGATFVLTGPAGEREVAAAAFFKDLFTTDLKPGEILTAVRVPCYGKGTGGAYLKHRHPASSYAVVGVAALLAVAGGRITNARLVVGGASVTPLRMAGAETALAGQAPGEAAFAAAAAKIAAAIRDPLSDVYASGEFRVHLAGVLARRALGAAAQRA